MKHTNLIQFPVQRCSRNIGSSKQVSVSGVDSSPIRSFLILFLMPLLFLLTWPGVSQGQFLYTTNSDGTTLTITGYSGSNGMVTIPDNVGGLPVTSIGDWAFYATSVTNVSIPDTVSTIGDGAFFDCESLTNVTVGNSVVSIGDWAFGFCTNLTGITFRGNPPGLGGPDVFYDDTKAVVYYLPTTTGWSTPFGGLPALPSGYIPLPWGGPVSLVTTNNVTYAEYTWLLGDCLEMLGLGPLIREGNNFRYDFDYARRIVGPCPLFVVRVTTSIALGTLAPGTYTLITTSWGTPAATNTFTIPVPTPTLHPIGFAGNGSFQIQLLNGVTNVSYILQCSTNLVNWTSLSTNSVEQPLRDATPVLPGHRFYRVQALEPEP